MKKKRVKLDHFYLEKNVPNKNSLRDLRGSQIIYGTLQLFKEASSQN